ncbi:pilin [Candidatus Parcubacteria bacterium]|nr:pilin [Candidatus Parcubacteria bacterium]
MKKFLIPVISLFILTSFSVVLAQNPGTGTQGGANPGSGTQSGGKDTNIGIHLENPFKTGGSISELLKSIINNIILPIGGVLAVLGFIFAGFKYVTAQGDPTKVSNASRALLYTAIGTAILLGAWAISEVIYNTVKSL